MNNLPCILSICIIFIFIILFVVYQTQQHIKIEGYEQPVEVDLKNDPNMLNCYNYMINTNNDWKTWIQSLTPEQKKVLGTMRTVINDRSEYNSVGQSGVSECYIPKEISSILYNLDTNTCTLKDPFESNKTFQLQNMSDNQCKIKLDEIKSMGEFKSFLDIAYNNYDREILVEIKQKEKILEELINEFKREETRKNNAKYEYDRYVEYKDFLDTSSSNCNNKNKNRKYDQICTGDCIKDEITLNSINYNTYAKQRYDRAIRNRDMLNSIQRDIINKKEQLEWEYRNNI